MVLVNPNLQRVGNTTEDELEQLFQLLENGEETLGNQTLPAEATMVLGNTGSGKSTFAWWIADYDELYSEKDPYTPGEFVIKDPYGKIGTDPTKSQTVYPDLVINNNTKAAYYDFPGFIDTRGAAYDIAIAYFIKKVVESVEKVKMVCIVSYNSVTGQGTRDDFVKLVTYATNFVKHSDKYINSTTLTVSKVPNLYSYLPDQDIIDPIANFINTTRGQFVGNPNALQFIDGLLQKNGDLYPRIWLSGLRGVNQTGSLNDMPQVQEKKHNMQAELEKLNYVQTSTDDFGYGVPKQSLADARTMIEGMNKRILANVSRFGEETQKYLYNEQLKLQDMVALYNQTTPLYNQFAETKEKANSYDLEPEKCVGEIRDSLSFVNTPIALESLSNAMKNANYSSFLHTVSGIDVQFKCADGLNDAIEYADKSRKWYKFLIDLYNDKLSTYEVQRNTTSSTCNGLAKFVIEGEDNENKPSDILEKYVKECSPQYDFQPVSNITMDKPKFTALQSLLNLTMNYQLDSWCESDNQLTIRGQYVKLSDIRRNNNTCQTPAQFIKIFALDRIFVDEDLEKNGEIQLSIIAPTWDILGNRKVVLQGELGQPHDPQKAPEGTAGKPGLPGGPGGNFFGIGDKFYNFADFVLSLIGGSGGLGQDGGDGAAGSNGRDATNDIKLEDKYPKESVGHKIRSYSDKWGEYNGVVREEWRRIYETYILAGEDGGNGGDGGDGGKEGKGANPGNYIFISTSSNGINLIPETKVGPDGLQGNAGLGATEGGKNGQDMQVEVDDGHIYYESPSFKSTKLLGDRGRAPGGKDGVKGANTNGSETPKEPAKLTNTSTIVNEYKAYLRENLFHSVREFDLRDFLDKLEGSTFDTQNHPRQRRSADIDLDRVTPSPTQQNTNFVTNPAIHTLNSSLNTATNLVTNFSALFASFYPTMRNAIGLMSKGPYSSWSSSSTSQSKYNDFFSTTPGLGHINGSPSVTFDGFDANSSIAFADFLIRCVTKVKPHDSREDPTNFTEIKASTLNIVTEFEKMLIKVAVELDLPKHQLLEFDPILLISKLDKELSNQNYQKISKILYQSIENKDGLDYVYFENHMQPKINRVLGGQQEQNLYNSCIGNENHPMNNVRIGIGARSEFKRIGYKMEENYKLK